MYLSRLMQKDAAGVKPDEMAELRINPALNRCFEWVLNFELAMIRRGINLSLGGSRLVVARKLSDSKEECDT
ncbi:hypothetical protein D3C80_1978310 [compost metagenome]